MRFKSDINGRDIYPEEEVHLIRVPKSTEHQT